MSNGTSLALSSEQDLASIPMAGGGLSRLAIARLKSAGVPVTPLLKRVGLAPEVIAEREERLNVRRQIRLLDEAAIALKDDRFGFTLAGNEAPRNTIEMLHEVYRKRFCALVYVSSGDSTSRPIPFLKSSGMLA